MKRKAIDEGLRRVESRNNERNSFLSLSLFSVYNISFCDSHRQELEGFFYTKDTTYNKAVKQQINKGNKAEGSLCVLYLSTNAFPHGAMNLRGPSLLHGGRKYRLSDGKSETRVEEAREKGEKRLWKKRLL